MSKKHFQKIADALREQKTDFNPKHPDKHLQWCRDVQAIADVCASFNPLFNRERFLSACGLTQETNK